MADEKDVEKREDLEQGKIDKGSGKAGSLKTLAGRFSPWIIMTVVVALCVGAGFGLGRVFASRRETETAEPSQQAKPAHTQLLKASGAATDSEKTWYYDLEPVVANLNEPGITRYVRVTLTLEISGEVDQKKAIAFFEQKNPLLKNWLTIYLASQTLEDIRGERNLRRIQSQISDVFNEKLFPDTKPQIRGVLFKELAIQ